MESIDNLLGILHSQRGRELRFEVGQRARLVTDAGVFDLSPTPLTPADTRNFVGPIVPDGARQALISQPSADFEYDCNGVGLFKVRAVKTNGAMSFYFMPVGGTGGLPTAQAPPAASPQPRQSGSLTPPSPTQARPSGSLSQTPPQGRPSGSLSQTPPQPAPPSPAQVRAPQGSAGSLTMESLFRTMFQVGASDLHLSVSMPPMIRKDGQMAALDPSHPALTADDTKRLVSSIMPKRNAEEFERRNDSDFAHEISGLARFRCNVFRDRKGIGGVFRVIPNKILTAEDLKLSSNLLKLCSLNKGLVLVTGPTGSGKSTTLCALIDYINRQRTDHIITIEDPIEFVHENKKCLINQRE